MNDSFCLLWSYMFQRPENLLGTLKKKKTILLKNVPWILVSDLNEIVDPSEKLEGKVFCVKRHFLRDFI